jgi:UDP-N-acetylglucosamine 2-epimerase (non-hydrolysing)
MVATQYELSCVLGTRPEIIKLAPVIRAAEASAAFSLTLIHTGQHYDDELSDVFFRQLNLPQPDEHLAVGSGAQGEQTAEALVGIEDSIERTEPDAVLALGDTNAVLSAALATSKMEPLFAHLEAGIRSFDRSMPEEINRVLADEVTDLAFAPTETGVQNLAAEGKTDGVWMVGNTIVDACREHAPLAAEQSTVLQDLELQSDEYAVATIHRPRNTDNEARLLTILETLDEQSFPVVFPAHPRTQNQVSDLGFEQIGSLQIIDPLDYLDFLHLLNNACVVVTDSGGIQEEASILEIPCLTVRPNTERPETIDAGVNSLVEPDELDFQLDTVYSDPMVRDQMTGAPDLYGDGTAAEAILSILRDEL